MTILEELKKREILYNISNPEKMNKMPVNSGVYIGFDPSADSLHLGNYLQIITLKRFLKYGFKPFAIIGGITGMIGDPSGKNKERNFIDANEILKNKIVIKNQLVNFGLEVIDNLSFYENMSIVDFLRNIGKQININYMLNKSIIKKRLADGEGISFTEFTYQLIQGWDFKCLYEKHQIAIQVGGSDQWGNITTGIELIRKCIGDNNSSIGITTKLLTNSNGQKFGKSESNPLWLDSKKTPPFLIYQYLFNTSDNDVEKFLKWMTFLSLNDIEKIMKEHNVKPHLRIAQKKLACEVVQDIYGDKELKFIDLANQILFGNISILNINDNILWKLKNLVPTYQTTTEDVVDNLVHFKLVESKKEAIDLIKNNAIKVNGQIIKNKYEKIEFKNIDKHFFAIIQKGKKKHIFIIKKELSNDEK